MFPVRLACVKHAASVHPEPGSNSLIKFVSGQDNLWLPIPFTVCWLLTVRYSMKFALSPSNHKSDVFKRSLLRIFENRMCLTVQLSRFLSLRQLVYFITFVYVCQEFFYFFEAYAPKRRRGILNPRAAINDLLPFRGAPSASLGTSPNCPFRYFHIYFFSISNGLNYNSIVPCFVKSFFIFFFHFFFDVFSFISNLSKTNGESGIRTHAPLRTNGFQDRLVMTTSISLHIEFSRFFSHLLCQRRSYSIIKTCRCQYRFYIFLQKTLYRFD